MGERISISTALYRIATNHSESRAAEEIVDEFISEIRERESSPSTKKEDKGPWGSKRRTCETLHDVAKMIASGMEIASPSMIFKPRGNGYRLTKDGYQPGT